MPAAWDNEPLRCPRIPELTPAITWPHGAPLVLDEPEIAALDRVRELRQWCRCPRCVRGDIAAADLRLDLDGLSPGQEELTGLVLLRLAGRAGIRRRGGWWYRWRHKLLLSYIDLLYRLADDLTAGGRAADAVIRADR